MSTSNIDHNVEKERKIFTAEFDKYQSDKAQVKIVFKDIKDDEGNLVKEFYWINALDAKELVGTLSPGDIVEFEAAVEPNELYYNGAKIMKPLNIRKKQ